MKPNIIFPQPPKGGRQSGVYTTPIMTKAIAKIAA